MDPNNGSERKRVVPQEVSVNSAPSRLHTLVRDLLVLTSTWLDLQALANVSSCNKRMYDSLRCGDDPRELAHYTKRLIQAVRPNLCLRLLHDEKLCAYARRPEMIDHCREVLKTHSSKLQAELVNPTSTLSIVVQLAPTVRIVFKMGEYNNDPVLLGDLEIYPYDDQNALHLSLLADLFPLVDAGLESECAEHFQSHRLLFCNVIDRIKDKTGTRKYPTPFPNNNSNSEDKTETEYKDQCAADSNPAFTSSSPDQDKSVKPECKEQHPKTGNVHDSSLLELLSTAEMYNVQYLLTQPMKVDYAYSYRPFDRHGRREGRVLLATFDLSPFHPNDPCIWREVTRLGDFPSRLKAGEKGTVLMTDEDVTAFDDLQDSVPCRNAKRKAFLDYFSSWMTTVPQLVTQTKSSLILDLPWRC